MGKFQKGHKLGRGNSNSGRKSKAEELELVKDKVTQEALIELANSKVYKELQKAKGIKNVKDLGLPITLKGMTDKKEIKGNFTIDEILDEIEANKE